MLVMVIISLKTLTHLFKFKLKYSYSIFIVNIIYATLVTTIVTYTCINNTDCIGLLYTLLLLIASIDTIVYLNLFKN